MEKAYSEECFLVTGASAGLGQDFAKSLAQSGSHLVLTARRKDRLETLKTELLQSYPTLEIQVVEADLSVADEVESLIRTLNQLPRKVTGVINNAGFGYCGRFGEEGWERPRDLLAVNIQALVRLSHWAAGQFSHAGHGFILNVASTAAYQPLPFMTTYGASKSFVSMFTLGLHEELRGRGVHVTALHPGKTQTDFFDAAGMKDEPFLKVPGMASPDVVKVGLRALRANRPEVIAGALNWSLAQLSRWAPLKAKLRIGRSLFVRSGA